MDIKGESPRSTNSEGVEPAGPRHTAFSRLFSRSDNKHATTGSDVRTPVQIVEMESSAPIMYRTYKRRWFGLAQLVLMNIIVSWDVRDDSLQEM